MKQRREFLKATGAALGGAALSGILPVEATAEPQGEGGRVHEAIRTSLGIFGCPGCGLLGVDLHIGGGDPEPLNVKNGGLTNASFTEL
jgi:anaerobic selenocysteine-containing dehydrogenase